MAWAGDRLPRGFAGDSAQGGIGLMNLPRWFAAASQDLSCKLAPSPQAGKVSSTQLQWELLPSLPLPLPPGISQGS